jgi:hypothetical protein
LFWVGCEDKETDDGVPGTSGPGFVDGSPSGSYHFTGVTLFESATCEGEGITHMCTDNIDNQADCEAASEEWLPLIDVFTGGDPASAPYLIFGADGLFMNPNCDSFPFTVDGTTITLEEGHCEGDTVDAENEAACTDAGGSWEDHIFTATINADGTITTVEGDDGHCDNSIYETEEECVANLYEWQSPSCMQLELTHDETHDGSCVPEGDDECEEHSDCESNYCNADGECIDCPYEYDCNGECGGGYEGYQCSDGSYVCNEEDCPVNVLGTYTAISAELHPGGDCSANDGVTGICTTDSTATSEAECPEGVCFDGSGSDETSCPEGMWYTGMCQGGFSGENEAECEEAGGDWMPFGWMNMIDAFGVFSITISDDGTFGDPNSGCYDDTGDIIDGYEDEASCEEAGHEWKGGDGGTWSLDGSTLTVTFDSECESSDEPGNEGGGSIDVEDEAACEAAGGEWEEGDVSTGIVSGNTITYQIHDESECETTEGGSIDAEDEATCDSYGGMWEDAQCIEIVMENTDN